MLVKRPPNRREHFFLQLPDLELDYSVHFCDSLSEVDDLLVDVVFEVAVSNLGDVSLLNIFSELLQLLLVGLVAEDLVYSAKHHIESIVVVIVLLKFVLER